MQHKTIDTNVPLTAAGYNDAVSDECVVRCVEFVESVLRGDAAVVLDQQGEALNELADNVPAAERNNNLAGSFLIHLFSNYGRAGVVHLVHLSKTEKGDYVDYPDPDDTWRSDVRRCERFDPEDKKWVAIALRFKAESGGDAPIVNAADRCWRAFEGHLGGAGVALDYLC